MKQIMGIDAGGTNIRCAVFSEGMKIISYSKEKIKNKNSKQMLYSQLTSIIDKSFSPKIKGIGIAVPAIIDIKKGVLYEAFNIPAWQKVPLKAMLEKKYKVKVLINNDANCFALGESLYGSAKDYKNIAGIILGTGFGVGIIINKKIYCGNNCAAGEFGRIFLKDKTIEDYCSGKFFINKYKLSGEKLYEMAGKGNKRALNAFREFGSNLGPGAAAIINSIDPECIIFGGSISKAYKFFKNSFLESLKKHIYKQAYKNIRIKASKTEKMGVLGAVSLFYESKR